MRRVLMISPHFPPDTSAGAHRVRLLAPHLPPLGWEATVLTVRPAAYEGRLDPDLSRLVPASLRVLRVPAWPASVTRLVGVGDLGLRALAGLHRTAAGLLAQERFDALFITIYPSYPALIGPRLKRRHRVPFILDYQDPWVGAWGLDVGPGRGGVPDVKSRFTRSLAAWLEPGVVRAADALTAVSARTYEDVLSRVPDARPRVCQEIPLGFDVQDIEMLRREPRPNGHFSADDGRVHVCYVGTVLPMGFEVLRAVLLAAKRLRERSPETYRRLRLHFLGTSNQRDVDAAPRVLPLADELGVRDIVSEQPARLDYLDALNVQVHAHVILLLGSSETHYTPSKVFPALLAGRPIIAVYHAASTVVGLLGHEPSATTIVFDEVHPVAQTIDAITAAFERVTAPGGRAADRRVTDARLAPWSAPALAGRLAGVLDAVSR